MAASSHVLRSTRDQSDLRSRFREIVRYRELLVNLVRKELKVRYKNSVLGFVWTLVNPAVTIAVYWVIFTKVFKNPIPAFVLFLMTGVLVFNMFQTALGSAVGSVVGNAPLVKKVWFPREILPLASIGAAMVDFLLQSIVLVGALVIFRWHIGWGYLLLIPAALVALLLFITALALWLAAVNVRYRDTQHFLGIVLMVWFWATPIIYSFQQVASKLPHSISWIQLLNPFTIVSLSFQRALYNKKIVNCVANCGGRNPIGKAGITPTRILPNHGQLWYFGVLAILAAVSSLLMLYTARKFRQLEGDFAEAL
jgi:ABC-2 type transport system permease protein